MYILQRIATVVAGLSLLTLTTAHSSARNPLTYISRVENAVIKTPSHRLQALSTFDLTFQLHGGQQEIKLSLSPNHAILPEGASIKYIGDEGESKTELIDRSNYLVYKGHTFVKTRHDEWVQAGWARIVVRQDGENPLFEGAFRLDGNHHHVQTRARFMQTRQQLDPELEAADEEYLVVWRDSDIGRSPAVVDDEQNLHKELKRATGVTPSCEADFLRFNTQPDHPVFRAMKRDDSFWGSMSSKHIMGRQIDGQTLGNSAGINLLENIGSTAGCSSTRKVALVGMATDCTYTASFSTEEELRINVISIVNSASVQYEDSFNITLGLKNLQIMKKACPASASPDAPWNVACGGGVEIQDRLNLFSAWRGLQADSNAFWTLMSTCETGSAVGLAWLGQACVQKPLIAQSADGSNETVSGANVVVKTDNEWQVLAHEVGHTFGAVHDCNTQTCASQNTVNSQQCCPLSKTQCDAGGKYIMNPSTGNNIRFFSPCSIGNICTAIGRNSVKTSCLTQNKDVSIITGSQCGNGIVESGEDCDCGGVSGCGDNNCCDPTTCKFKQAAVCDPSNEDCCSQTCQFASSGTVCRASTGQCDPQETCSGASATCPADASAPDGQSCGTSLSCASGQCTSRNLQCKTLMGGFTTQNDTFACSNQGCQISCQSPEFGSNVCYSMKQNFLDGTSCEGGGKCQNGACSGGSFSKELQSWLARNKTLVIALSCVIGGLLLISIVGCCVSRHKRRKLQLARAPPPPPSQQPIVPPWQARRSQQFGAGGQNYIPPVMSQRNSRQVPGGGGWGNDGRWNPNAGYGTQPPPPAWQPSVRYA